MGDKIIQTATANALAAWTEMEGLAKVFEAQALRGDTAGAEDTRARLHATLDAYLDLKGEYAKRLRDMIGRA